MPLSGPSSFLSGQPEQPGKLRTTPDFTFCAYSNPWRCKGRIEAVVAEPDAPPPGLALFPRVLRWGAPRDSLCQPGQVLPIPGAGSPLNHGASEPRPGRHPGIDLEACQVSDAAGWPQPN